MKQSLLSLKGGVMNMYKGTIVFLAFFFTGTSLARTIKVKNNITDKDKKYKFMFTKYTPSKFSIKVNGLPIEQGKEKNITIKQDKFKVRYDFEFGKHRSGANIVEFSLPKKIDSISITFNWKKKWRILIEGATPLSVESAKV